MAAPLPPTPPLPSNVITTSVHFSPWLLPGKLILRSPLTLVAYTGGFLFALGWLVLIVQHAISEFLADPTTSIDIPIFIMRRLEFAVSVLTWAVTSPVVITIVTVPISLLIIEGNIKVERLIRDTSVSIRLATRTIIGALIRAFYFLIPIVAMISLYTYLLPRVKFNYFLELYSLAAVIVGAPFIMRAIPLLIAPFIAVAGLMPPYEALDQAGRMYRARVIQITLVLLLIGSLSAGAFYIEALRISLPAYLVPAVTGVACWYLFTVLAGLVIESLTVAYQTDVLKVQEEIPIGQLQKRLPTGQEIYIHIQNLHLGGR